MRKKYLIILFASLPFLSDAQSVFMKLTDAYCDSLKKIGQTMSYNDPGFITLSNLAFLQIERANHEEVNKELDSLRAQPGYNKAIMNDRVGGYIEHMMLLRCPIFFPVYQQGDRYLSKDSLARKQYLAAIRTVLAIENNLGVDSLEKYLLLNDPKRKKVTLNYIKKAREEIKPYVLSSSMVHAIRSFGKDYSFTFWFTDLKTGELNYRIAISYNEEKDLKAYNIEFTNKKQLEKEEKQRSKDPDDIPPPPPPPPPLDFNSPK